MKIPQSHSGIAKGLLMVVRGNELMGLDPEITIVNLMDALDRAYEAGYRAGVVEGENKALAESEGPLPDSP